MFIYRDRPVFHIIEPYPRRMARHATKFKFLVGALVECVASAIFEI